jgi:hypothetical protein
MPIEWEVLITEMTILGAIIYSAIFLDHWVEKTTLRRKEKEDARRIITFVADDLHNKLRFIEDSVRYKDFKPFFTDMWDAVILGGKQTVLPFKLFENLQHTYSWMKYYNNELEQRVGNEVSVIEVLDEVKGSISQSFKLLKEIRV